jgi:hypothetical protein
VRTAEAFEVIESLAVEYDILSGIDASSLDIILWLPLKKPFDIPRGHELERLSTTPFWPSVVELYGRRYFRRLWVIQEIVLSTRAAVVCGSQRIDWVSFHKGASLLCLCSFLHKRSEVMDYELLLKIRRYGETRQKISSGHWVMLSDVLEDVHPLSRLPIPEIEYLRCLACFVMDHKNIRSP